MVCVICGLCDRETLKIPEIYHFLELCLTESGNATAIHVPPCVSSFRRMPICGTSLYLAASASAEFFADIALAPMGLLRFEFKPNRLC